MENYIYVVLCGDDRGGVEVLASCETIELGEVFIEDHPYSKRPYRGDYNLWVVGTDFYRKKEDFIEEN